AAPDHRLLPRAGPKKRFVCLRSCRLEVRTTSGGLREERGPDPDGKPKVGQAPITVGRVAKRIRAQEGGNGPSSISSSRSSTRNVSLMLRTAIVARPMGVRPSRISGVFAAAACAFPDKLDQSLVHECLTFPCACGV